MAASRRHSVLGIETSCDETAAAVVRGRPGHPAEILSNVVLTQIDEHRPYGGVVPEIAARAHIDHLDGIVARALEEADATLQDMDGIAATAGPGLIGGVMVGLMTGKALAAAAARPFLAVNHLEAHALSIRLIEPVRFPYLLLLVSGGHCQLVDVVSRGVYRLIGTTIDDAVGEAFDKTAKLLALGYPGGPAVETAAMNGDPARFALPRPMLGRPGCDFSFSGLKTAVLHAMRDAESDEQTIADMAASFQAAVTDSLADRTANAMAVFAARHKGAKRRLVVAGGVAANGAIRHRLRALCEELAFDLFIPPLHLCTDNAAMVAWAGLERLVAGESDPLDAPPRARWPLDPDGARHRAEAAQLNPAVE